MREIENLRRGHSSLFSQLLAERRAAAGLTLGELAEMTRLPLSFLENLESDGRATLSFDNCYKIAQALNSRRPRGFVMHDLWQAANLSRHSPHHADLHRERETKRELRAA
jgi:transcriptional regulator with XRE-family HTH domain